ncbi:MAG: hypothetical protein CVV44_12640 [Spirochaetae bacterium HGW-Spirochaetae-1]|jgi:hypothetical protein|nr:MAG: hypothetical protein CVV44_12640 [Spirochaetae bacterium HGW-Spirochaetae-1]
MSYRIVVVSDSHGNLHALRRIVEHEYPFDMLIHCGDGVGDLFHAGIPLEAVVVRVPGNVDMGRVTDMEQVVFHDVGDRRIMVTHGDLFRLHQGYEDILREGRKSAADFIFFGHTHKKFLLPGKPLLFNPGPVSSGVYGLVTIDGEWRFEHRRLEEGQ